MDIMLRSNPCSPTDLLVSKEGFLEALGRRRESLDSSIQEHEINNDVYIAITDALRLAEQSLSTATGMINQKIGELVEAVKWIHMSHQTHVAWVNAHDLLTDFLQSISENDAELYLHYSIENEIEEISIEKAIEEIYSLIGVKLVAYIPQFEEAMDALELINCGQSANGAIYLSQDLVGTTLN